MPIQRRSEAGSPDPTTDGPAIDHPNDRLARAIWAATSTGDADALREQLAPDVVWNAHSAGSLSGEYGGVEAVIELLARAGDLVDDLRVDLSDMLVSNRGAVVSYHLTARRGDRVLDTDMLLVSHIREGRVTEVFTVPVDAVESDRFWSLH
jgi:ketosteroid isomerase-like protein